MYNKARHLPQISVTTVVGHMIRCVVCYRNIVFTKSIESNGKDVRWRYCVEALCFRHEMVPGRLMPSLLKPLNR